MGRRDDGDVDGCDRTTSGGLERYGEDMHSQTLLTCTSWYVVFGTRYIASVSLSIRLSVMGNSKVPSLSSTFSSLCHGRPAR